MATIQILQSSDTQLSNGKYYAIGTIEDVGQIIYAPFYRLDRIAPLPADADTVPYKLGVSGEWENYSVQAQAALTDAAEKQAADAQAQAKAAQAKYLQLMLASAKASATDDSKPAASTETEAK